LYRLTKPPLSKEGNSTVDLRDESCGQNEGSNCHAGAGEKAFSAPALKAAMRAA
jgi:hypothetical protein